MLYRRFEIYRTKGNNSNLRVANRRYLIPLHHQLQQQLSNHHELFGGVLPKHHVRGLIRYVSSRRLSTLRDTMACTA